jgi:hypothetical protein
MTTFSQFSQRCKMRHDFDDQIQVRYWHTDDEHYDAWVSGTEVLQRLESFEREDQLRSLSQLGYDDLRLVLQSLPEAARSMLRHSLRDVIASGLETNIGGNRIGDALSEAVRGRSNQAGTTISEQDRWQSLMRFEPFRLKVIELAWIALEGSFPNGGMEPEPDDWL